MWQYVHVAHQYAFSPWDMTNMWQSPCLTPCTFHHSATYLNMQQVWQEQLMLTATEKVQDSQGGIVLVYKNSLAKHAKMSTFATPNQTTGDRWRAQGSRRRWGGGHEPPVLARAKPYQRATSKSDNRHLAWPTQASLWTDGQGGGGRGL